MREYEKLKTEYLCYLMNRAKIEAEGSRGYVKLCATLQDTEFYPLLSMDENRSCDCRNLRREFADDYDDETYGDILDGIYSENGTIMELLVILGEKMSYDLADSEYEADTGKWVFEMLQNCGLITASNKAFEEDPDGEEDFVKDVLDKVIFRKFGWDGEGSFFPLRWPHSDQRYEELINQMNDYIEENYDIC